MQKPEARLLETVSSASVYETVTDHEAFARVFGRTATDQVLDALTDSLSALWHGEVVHWLVDGVDQPQPARLQL